VDALAETIYKVKGLLNNNKSKVTKSGVKGVCWDKREKKWRSYIMFKGKLSELGYFLKLEDAIKAKREAEEKLFRPFEAIDTAYPGKFKRTDFKRNGK